MLYFFGGMVIGPDRGDLPVMRKPGRETGCDVWFPLCPLCTERCICVPGYLTYVLVCAYAVNGARGFAAGFWQLLAILFIMNLIDRLRIDEVWVGHTRA